MHFIFLGNLRAHVLKTHTVPNPEERVFACTECSCIFKKLGSLNGHMTRNHPEIKTIENIKILNRLIDTQTNQNDEKEQNNSEEVIAKTEIDYFESNDKNDQIQAATIAIADVDLDGKIHRYQIKQRTIGTTRWHLCNYCTKEFRKPSDLVRHLRVHTREKPFHCKICNRAFAVKSTLTTHLKIHENEKKEHVCKICPKLFPCLNDYNDHVAKFHTLHTCKTCGRHFRNVRLLKQHSHVHMSKEELEKTINEELLLQEPIILTNKGIQTVDISVKKRPLKEAGSVHRPYRCSICGGCYRNLSHLKQHRIMHTNDRPYKCRVCRDTFQNKQNLKNHMLKHIGNKPYNCAICNKQFTVLGSLKRHMDSHNTTRSVICPYCFKNFKTVVTCRNHIKTHKGEKAYEAKEDDFSPKINEIPYPPDLEDALANDTFNLTPIQTPATIKSCNEVIPSLTQIHMEGRNAILVPVNETTPESNISRKFLFLTLC